MSSAVAVEEGELPSSPDRGEDEDLEEGEILESDNEENGENEAKRPPTPPKLIGGHQEKTKDREREESPQRNTRKGIEVWADFYQTSRSVAPQRTNNRHSDDSPYSDSDPEQERSYTRDRREKYDVEEDRGRGYDREVRVVQRDERPREYGAKQRKEAARAPKPVPRVTCKFWARGVCRKGDDCEFAHEGVRHKKKELCKFYSSGVCGRGRDCLFLHGEFPCKFFHTGNHCYDGPSCRFSHEKLTPDMEEVLQKALNSSRDEATNSQPDAPQQPEVAQLPRLYGSDDTSHNVKVDMDPEWGNPHASVTRQLIIVPGRPVLLPYPDNDLPVHLQSPLMGTRLPHVSENDISEYQQRSDDWEYENRDDAWAEKERKRDKFGDQDDQYGYQLESNGNWDEGQHPNDWVPQRQSPPLEEDLRHPSDWQPPRQPIIEDNIHVKERRPNDWIPRRPLMAEEPVGPKPPRMNDWISQRPPDLMVEEHSRDWRPRKRSPLLDGSGELTRGGPNDWVPRRESHDPRPQFDLDEIPADFDAHPGKKPRIEPEGQFTENTLGLVVGQVRSLAPEMQETRGMVPPLDTQMRHSNEIEPRGKGFVEPMPYDQEGQRPPRYIEDPVRDQANFIPLSGPSHSEERKYRQVTDQPDRENWNRIDPPYSSAERPMGEYRNERPRERFTPPSPPRGYDREPKGYVNERPRSEYSPPPPREYPREMEDRYVNEQPRDKFNPSAEPPARGYKRDPAERPVNQYMDRPRDQFNPPLVPPGRGFEREVAERPISGYMNERPRDRYSPQGSRYEPEPQYRDMRDSDWEIHDERHVRPAEPEPVNKRTGYGWDNRGANEGQDRFNREDPRRPVPPQGIPRDMGPVRIGVDDRQPLNEHDPVQPHLERHTDAPYENVRREDTRELRFQPELREEISYGYTSFGYEARDQPFTNDILVQFPDKIPVPGPGPAPAPNQEWDRRPTSPPQQYQYPEQRSINEQELPLYTKPSEAPRDPRYQPPEKIDITPQYSLPQNDYNGRYSPPNRPSPPYPACPQRQPIEPVVINQQQPRQLLKGQESTIQVSRDPRQRSRVQPENPPQNNVSLLDPRRQESPSTASTGTVLDIKMEMPPPKPSASAVAVSMKEPPKKQSLADLFKSIDPTASPFG